MRWERLAIPGRAALERRVRDRCCGGDQFVRMGARFGAWVADGRNAPRADVVEVERRLADYLDTAAGVGARWGGVIGTVTGLGTLVALLLCGLLTVAVR